jgi:hypothetical protein
VTALGPPRFWLSREFEPLTKEPISKTKSRDTGTGKILEAMIVPALQGGGYTCYFQHHVGERFGGGKHFVDAVAESKIGQKFLVSLKWQQVSGTAEQKVPFEAICLAETIINGLDEYSKAYLVLGGEGWKLRDFFIRGGLQKHLTHSGLVNICTLENFVARANRGEL